MLSTMRARSIPPLLLLLAALAAAPAAGREDAAPPREEVEALLRECFSASGRSRERVLDRLRALGPVPAREMKRYREVCLSLMREGSRSEGGSERTLGSGPTRGTYLVVGEGRGRKGLFIGLHGGGPGAGDARTAMQKWSGAAGKNCIAVFPQATRLVHDAWNQPDQERFVLEIVEELKRTYPVDTNRIYLAGHSMGGYGTWSIGGHHADLFAAISPNSGGVYGNREFGTGRLQIEQGVLPNLFRLPLRWFHGTDDPQCPIDNDLEAERILTNLREKHPGGYEFEFRKIDGIGHGLDPAGLSGYIDWLTRRKRDPYPSKVVWEPWVPAKPSLYWLHLPLFGRGVLIVAEIRRRREVRIETSGFVPKLRLLLSDELIDADREVVVTWNGTERFRGNLEPDLAALAQGAAERRDPEMLFTYRIDLE